MKLSEILADFPMIAAVRNEEDLRECFKTQCRIIFILYGSICNITEIVRQVKACGKIAIVHMDFVTGMAIRDVSVEFILRNAGADGIVSTKPNLVKDLPGGFDRAEFPGKAGGAVHAQRHRDHARDHAGYHQAGQKCREDPGDIRRPAVRKEACHHGAVRRRGCGVHYKSCVVVCVIGYSLERHLTALDTVRCLFIMYLSRMYRRFIGIAPLFHSVKNRAHRFSQFGKGIFHSWGNLCIHSAGDQSVCLHSPQFVRQDLLADAVQREYTTLRKQ